ncbi:MAG: DUF4412 domain-containing protein [Bacteroidota bacterium]
MKPVMRYGALVFCGFLCVANGFAQGVYFETSNSTKGEAGSKVWYMPHMLKAENEDNTVTILRLDRQEMYSVNPAEKTYTLMTFAEMKAKYTNATAKLEKFLADRMKTMTPEQKKMMEERMASLKTRQTETKVTATPTGKSKRIEGYSCQEYVVTTNGKEGQHVWTTRDFKEGESLRRDLSVFQDQVAAVVGREPGSFSWFGAAEGFPLERDEDGDVETVTKIERVSLPASAFEPPAGFTKVSADKGE